MNAHLEKIRGMSSVMEQALLDGHAAVFSSLMNEWVVTLEAACRADVENAHLLLDECIDLNKRWLEIAVKRRARIRSELERLPGRRKTARNLGRTYSASSSHWRYVSRHG